MKYCAYQERAHSEVEAKLKELGLFVDEAGEVIIELTRQGFLDEERFARSFTRGKFRMKHWGRRKIALELKRKELSEYCIRMGMEEIDEEEYQQSARKLAEQKWTSLKKEKSIWAKRKKTSSYLLQKGYEPEIINLLLSELAQV